MNACCSSESFCNPTSCLFSSSISSVRCLYVRTRSTNVCSPNDANGVDPCGDKLQPDYIPSAALSVGERVYPTRGLAIHEWRTHGVCTGLDAQHYFRAVQYARDEFTIPENLRHPTARFETSPGEIVKAFAAVNANLTPDSMAVTCERGELIDVRFCLTRNLQAFALCPDVVRRSCRSGSLAVSPPR